MKNLSLFLLLLLFSATAAVAEKIEKWESFISAKDLLAAQQDQDLVVIDVRSPAEYSAGHIPGAINLPGDEWRTPQAKPGEGDSQYLFYKADGSPDIARYEELLSKAGVENDDRIVVYGNHAGKADGSVPAFILRWLGHEETAFLDGIGIREWQQAGGKLSTEAASLPASEYEASPDNSMLWSLSQVKQNLGDSDTVFFDTRSKAEFEGTELRNNKRGGHIPGAVLINYEEMLGPDKRVLPPAEVQKQLEARGIEKDKTVVLYCQTATRVTLPALALLDLGYKDVAIYDASWHEYGNREDTEVSRSN